MKTIQQDDLFFIVTCLDSDGDTYTFETIYKSNDDGIKAALFNGIEQAIQDDFKGFQDDIKNHLELMSLVRQEKWDIAMTHWNLHFSRYGIFSVEGVIVKKDQPTPRPEDFCWEE